VARFSEAIGREREIRAARPDAHPSKKNNPLLIGDAGVGKTAVIEGLAYNMSRARLLHHCSKAHRTDRDRNARRRTSLRGQFEERLVGIVDEARNTSGIILFIDEIHTIVGAGDTIDSKS